MRLRKLSSIAILIVSLGALAFSAVKLVPYIREETQSASTYSDLAAFFSGEDVVLEDVVDEDGADGRNWGLLDTPVYGDANVSLAEETGETGEDEADESEDVVGSAYSDPEAAARLQTLHEKNNDCVAWLKIEGTVINYPVMYRPQSKDYYLHRDYYGKKSFAGALYISEICNPDTSDNVIIYGHHMNSGKMFAALNKYKKQSFYQEHQQIVLETLHGTEVYEVIFALTTPVYTGRDFKYYAFANARNAREFEEYIDNCKARALYDTGKTAQYGDRLLTLSTCEYSQRNGRMVVVARKVN